MILLNMCCRRKRVEKESEKVLYCTYMRTKQERQNIIIFYRRMELASMLLEQIYYTVNSLEGDYAYLKKRRTHQKI